MNIPKRSFTILCYLNHLGLGICSFFIFEQNYWSFVYNTPSFISKIISCKLKNIGVKNVLQIKKWRYSNYLKKLQFSQLNPSKSNLLRQVRLHYIGLGYLWGPTVLGPPAGVSHKENNVLSISFEGKKKEEYSKPYCRFQIILEENYIINLQF